MTSLFSPAKRHMVIVSSIRATAITNDYNDGARCLKEFLEYAEAVSVGNEAAARRILGITGGEDEEAEDSATDPGPEPPEPPAPASGA